jgi:hypothetical protein
MLFIIAIHGFNFCGEASAAMMVLVSLLRKELTAGGRESDSIW